MLAIGAGVGDVCFFYLCIPAILYFSVSGTAKILPASRSLPIVLIISCYITNHPNFSGLKQQ